MIRIAAPKGAWVGRARTLTFCVLAVLVAASIGVLLLAAKDAHAVTTFTVNRTDDLADSNLADNVCDTLGVNGTQCTLRAAIQQANTTLTSGGPDLIEFSVKGNGPHTISPSSALPTISQPVTIDGYTEGDATATTDDDATPNTLAKGTNAKLLIELEGTNLPGGRGLVINASNTTVRGLVINRFGRGIDVFGTNNILEGNFVGTDPSGTQDLGNRSDGVFISGTSNVVGGTTPEDRNLISGNGGEGFEGNGMLVQNDSTTDTRVQGNLIGTQKDGTSPLGNASHGVFILGADKTLVGGGGAGAANIIAFNGRDGMSVQDLSDSEVATGNKVLRNSIFSNGGLGIDLVAFPDESSSTNVSTANDGGAADDSDTGPNGLQNKPSLTSALTPSGGTTTIQGVLDTKPNKTFIVQFFSQPSGNEGKTFIGQASVPTDSDGRVTFSFSPNNAVAVGQKITAIATGAEGTSEFSAPREVTAS